MNMQEIPGFLITALEISAIVFIFAIGLLVFGVVVLYIIDKSQKKHAIRHNYPRAGAVSLSVRTHG